MRNYSLQCVRSPRDERGPSFAELYTSAGRTLAWIKVRQPDYRVEERGWGQDVNQPPKRR
jgi:hypothetical protein